MENILLMVHDNMVDYVNGEQGHGKGQYSGEDHAGGGFDYPNPVGLKKEKQPQKKESSHTR